jgi:hypothetical protein
VQGFPGKDWPKRGIAPPAGSWKDGICRQNLSIP